MPDRVLFALGFRPFFLGAGAFALLSAALWSGAWAGPWPVPFAAVPAIAWHAHEMIYGYAFAVIAGFLLTAVRNWTGIQTLHGPALAALFGCWALARLAAVLGWGVPLALFDCAFAAGLGAAVIVPVARARQWSQSGVVSKLVLLGAGNLVFYAGALGWLEQGVHWGVYAGLYLVIGLIMTLGRRVVPFFLHSALGSDARVRNWTWLDRASLVLYLAFFVLAVFTPYAALTAGLALALFVLHALRLCGWYDRRIWGHALLWSLLCAYGFIVAGFALHALSAVLPISAFAAVHAFAFGGIGLITLSMMVRVSLGHTARRVDRPPRAVSAAFLLMLAGALARVAGPVLDPARHALWVAAATLAWLAAFALFLWLFAPVLTRPRLDGRPG